MSDQENRQNQVQEHFNGRFEQPAHDPYRGVYEEPPYSRPMRRRGYDEYGRPRFSPRTVLIPLLFYMVHTGLQALVTAPLTFYEFFRSGGTLRNDELYERVLGRQSIIILVSGALSIIVFSLALRFLNRREPGYVMTRKPRGSVIGASLAITGGAIGVTTLILIGIQLIAQYSAFWDTALKGYIELSGAFGDSSGLVWQVLGIVIAAPIAEELLFRGIVVGELKRVLPDWAVILISGVFFAVIHMNLIQSTYVLAAGFVLGAAYVWTQSLIIPIIMHILFNFMGSTLPILLTGNEEALIWMSNIQMVLVPAGIFALVWMYRKYRAAGTAAA